MATLSLLMAAGSLVLPRAALAVGGVPSAPSGVVAVPGASSAVVSWQAPSDGGSPITGSVVTPYLGGVAQAPQSFTTPASTQTVTGLTDGSTYTFRVAATNANGTGPASAPSNPVTAGTPSAPGAPSPMPGDGSATVSWTAPASDGGSSITGYAVTPYLYGVPQPTQTFLSPALSETVTGLTNGGRYTFTVAAINDHGTGLLSEYSREMVVGVPALPSSVSAVAGSLSATVSWTVPDDHGSAIVRYRVAVCKPGQWFPLSSFYVDPTVTTTTVNNLVAGQNYFFAVAAWNSRGQSYWSPSNAITIAP